MQADYLSDVSNETLQNPQAAEWGKVSTQDFPMMGTPVALQPTEAIRSEWADKKIGTVESVKVSAAHNGRTLFLRLQWKDATSNRNHSDNSTFPDGAAVALSNTETAPLVTMGAPGQAITFLHWRADEPSGRHVLAEGIGSSETIDTNLVKTQAEWKDGEWTLVLSRDLSVISHAAAVQLKAGEKSFVGFAIWSGSAGERGGIKTFSGNWISMDLQSV